MLKFIRLPHPDTVWPVVTAALAGLSGGIAAEMFHVRSPFWAGLIGGLCGFTLFLGYLRRT